MLLTRIWGVILAFLATSCLAGMFLVSLGSGSDFSEADRAALRAVTEAGLAALQAEIHASPVRQGVRALYDDRMREALARTPEEEAKLPVEKLPLPQIISDVAEDVRMLTRSDMTIGLVDKNGSVIAASGLAEPLVAELVASTAYQEAPTDFETTSSVLLGAQIHVATVARPDERGRRLVALQVLPIEAASLLRRVLTTEHPAGLVRGGKLVGDIIGDQPVQTELERAAVEQGENAPADSTASQVFVVGEGLHARIGSLGRLPGPAGKGKNGVMLVVLSRQTAAAGQRDLAGALAQAREKGGVARLNWVALIGLVVVSVGLAIYLPQLEALGPTRRLAAEFRALAQGTQHQIFHDRYGGAIGEIARSANAAHEALRQAYLAELEIEGDDDGSAAVSEHIPTGQRTRPRTLRPRKQTRSQRKTEEGVSDAAATSPRPPARGEGSGADVIGAPEPAPPRASAPAPAREAAPAPASAAPVSGGHKPTVIGQPMARPTAPAAKPPRPGLPSTPPAMPPAPPPPAPVVEPAAMPLVSGAPSGDPREAYYREIYEEFVQVKIACGEPLAGLSFDKFAKKLQKNTEDLMAKGPEVRDVQFTVYVKDGKAALKAKVVKD